MVEQGRNSFLSSPASSWRWRDCSFHGTATISKEQASLLASSHWRLRLVPVTKEQSPSIATKAISSSWSRTQGCLWYRSSLSHSHLGGVLTDWSFIVLVAGFILASNLGRRVDPICSVCDQSARESLVVFNLVHLNCHLALSARTCLLLLLQYSPCKQKE